ncbi:MAG: sortase, partial [Chloroflexales bacterium]|nr:sortase [Chloroflexales bacterium]
AALSATAPAPTSLPAREASAAEGQIASAPPAPSMAAHVSTVERIILPTVKLDSKVIEVGWQIVEQGGQQVAVWDVAEYAVGQHKGSANPGEGGNIVLAGHVGGYGHVFRDIYYVHPGEPVILYSEGREYRYVVKERLIVDEEGASPEQRAANALLIAPTDHEMVTMITCWPPKGPKKFTQRVLLRAVPEGAEVAP